MRRPGMVLATAGAALALAVLGGVSPAAACAGLIGSNGAVNLGRTTTLAAYSDGVEHYVTAFKFLGGGGQFGTLIPLPDVPTSVERGGAWTLQRLARETQLRERVAVFSAQPTAAGAQVLLETRVDALDITVLKGGGADVAEWAHDHGFRLSPDAPEVLDFYAQRSPIFLAAVFDGDAAQQRGQRIGDGTPVHLTIPTANPWVPLRILGLGKQPTDRVDADVYLLTDQLPVTLPGPRGAAEKPQTTSVAAPPVLSIDRSSAEEPEAKPYRGRTPSDGLVLTHSAAATSRLLDDLRGDDGMGWVPQSAWLTQLRVASSVADLRYDLAIDASGLGKPSPVAAGLEPPTPPAPTLPVAPPEVALGLLLLALPLVGVVRSRARP